MKAVQMTLDDDLIRSVDRLARQLGTTRSAFTRQALADALARARVRDEERRHRRGYKAAPVQPHEFVVREDDRAWGDDWQEK